MAKFNDRPKPFATAVTSHPAATTNFEGGLAFNLDAATRLYTRVVTSMVSEPKFYQGGKAHDAELVRDIRLVAETEPEFILQLAAYARQVMNLRSVSVMLLVEAARIGACRPFVRWWTPQVVRRADEPTEVVSYWTNQVGHIGSQGASGGENAFPNSLKKGLADSFGNFDEYQLAKYDRDGAVRLRDVLRIIDRGTGRPLSPALRNYLVNGDIDEAALPLIAAKAKLMRKTEFDAEALELANAAHVTWEVLVSKFGASKAVWEAVRPLMGYMALLRNLRNFLTHGVDLAPVIATLTDPDQVRRSKQLPFRFFSAYREIEKLHDPQGGRLLKAISQALELSTANLPRLPGTTFIVSDNSGSMDSALNSKSSVLYSDVANLLGAIAHSLCENAVTGSFGTDYAPVAVNPADSILTNMKRFKEADTCGMATNAYRTLQYLRGDWRHGEAGNDSWNYGYGRSVQRTSFPAQTKPVKVDRIIILSDMQCYDSGRGSYGYGRSSHSLAEELRRYRQEVNPNVTVYSVDLAGYGTAQFPSDEPRVALLAGWSERLFDLIPLFEQDKTTAVNQIRTWQPKARRSTRGESTETTA